MLRRAALGIAAENPQPCAGLSAYRQGEDLQRKARAAGNADIMKSIQKSLNNQHITITS
ncbi:hypothetical protein ABIC74_001490 [Mucilaginibacter rubeus]